jgi:hypothetical protein
MIAPLVPFAISGAIWYQGESNAGRAYQYRRLFSDMILNWRRDWAQGDFPFLAVQLAPNETSVGWWRVGPRAAPYGRFARGFHAASGRTAMSFVLDTRLWGGLPLPAARGVTLRLRLVYFDAGGGVLADVPLDVRVTFLGYRFDGPNELARARYVLDAREGGELFGEPNDWVYSELDAEANEPERLFAVRKGREITRLAVACPREATAALLVRSYDANHAFQGALVRAEGHAVGHFYTWAKNYRRRFAQDSLWIELEPADCADGSLSLAIDATASPALFTENAYDVAFFGAP